MWNDNLPLFPLKMKNSGMFAAWLHDMPDISEGLFMNENGITSKCILHCFYHWRG